MTNLPTPETLQEAPAVEQEPNGIIAVGRWWPHLLLGFALATAMFGIGPDSNPNLLWVPAALLLGWIALQILSIPRPPKAEPDYAAFDREYGDEPEVVTADAAPVTEAPKAAAPTAAPAAPVADFKGIAILWGSETGNAKGLAEQAEARLKDAGLDAKAIDMEAMSINNLPACSQILVITSTWGDGEPPSNAIPMWEALQKQKVDLSKVGFSVLALGDTGYPLFCQCGKDFDKFLEAQGGKRLHPRIDCDLEFDENFEKWISGVSKAIQAQPAVA